MLARLGRNFPPPDEIWIARLKVALRSILSAALIYFIVRKVDWPLLGTVLARIDLGWAILASSLTGLLIAALAFRWQIFKNTTD